MKKYFLGIDGGGTKTAICLIDENMNIISSSVSGPSSYDTVTLETMKNNILNGINNLLYDGEIASVFAGIGGIAKKEDSEIVKKMLSTIPCLNKAIIEVDNDIVNAYYSALGNEDGIVVIIGTGSVAYGVHNNKSHRCGGYCYQEGDAGSSYDLGRKALQYYAKVIDKRLPASSFSQAIANEINIHNFGDLAHYFINATRTQIASLSKVVTANAHDENARKIIINGVTEILEMIDAVFKELKFSTAKISIIGSLGNADTLYKEILLKEIGKRKLTYVPLKYEAYLGSSIKALINYERNK